MQNWKPVSRRKEIIYRLLSFAAYVFLAFLFGEWFLFMALALVVDWWFRRAVRRSRERGNAV
jgi:hypothetical protein